MPRDLDHLTLARPCPVALPAMGPGERARHCDHCDKTVHNLSALPRAEAEALLAAPEALCVSYLRTPSGPLLFDLARTASVMSAALLAACFRMGGKPPEDLAADPPATTAPVAPSAAEEPLHTAEGPFRTHPDLPADALLVAVLGPDGFPYPSARLRVVAADAIPTAPPGAPPVGDVFVDFTRPDFGPDGGGAGPAAAEGVTNTRGHVLLRGLAPGRYVLHADGGDRGHGHGEVTLAGDVGVLGGVVLIQPDQLEFGGI